MKVIAICLITLAVASAGIISKYPLQYGGKRSIMNIMMEVENKLKTGGPLETVNGVLNGFKNAVGDEQIQHDEIQGLQKGECDSEIAYRRGEVQEANNILKTANGILKISNILLGKTQATAAATEDILTQTRQHLSLINDMRKDETQAYNRAAVTFNDAINAIDDGLDLVGEFGKASFIQIASLSSRMLKHAVELKKAPQYMKVMQALAQLKQEDDVSAVERLGQLLATLRADVEAAWQSYGEENTESLGYFTAQKERFTLSVSRLEANEKALANKMENLAGTISVQTAVAQAATNRRSRNQTLLDDASTLCHSFDVEYASTTAGRRAELVLVAELERLVEKRLSEKAQE